MFCQTTVWPIHLRPFASNEPSQPDCTLKSGQNGFQKGLGFQMSPTCRSIRRPCCYSSIHCFLGAYWTEPASLRNPFFGKTSCTKRQPLRGPLHGPLHGPSRMQLQLCVTGAVPNSSQMSDTHFAKLFALVASENDLKKEECLRLRIVYVVSVHETLLGEGRRTSGSKGGRVGIGPNKSVEL